MKHLLICQALVFSLVASGPIWSQSPDLVVSKSDGTTGAELSFELDPGLSSTNFNLDLLNKGMALQSISLETSINDGRGRRIANATGRFSDRLSNQRIEGIAKDQKVFANLALAGLPESGPLEVEVFLVQADSRTRISVLEIDRPQISSLRILEASDQKSLGLSAVEREFFFSLTLFEEDGRSGQVRIAVSPLVPKDGRIGQVPAEINCGTGKGGSCVLDFEPYGQEVIFLRGHLPERTEYKSRLQIDFPGSKKPQIYTLTVSRTGIGENLKTTVKSPWAQTIVALPFWRSSVEIPFSVTNQSSSPVTMYRPALEVFGPLGSNPELTQRSRVDSQVLEPLPNGMTRPVSASLSIEENALRNFHIRFDNIGAGAYSGKLMTSGPDSSIQLTDFTINIKHFWLVPFLVIGLGVACSYLLMKWTGAGRERNRRAFLIADEKELVEDRLADDIQNRVWLHLKKELARLRQINRYDLDPDQSIVTSLEELQERRLIYDGALLALAGSAPSAPPPELATLEDALVTENNMETVKQKQTAFHEKIKEPPSRGAKSVRRHAGDRAGDTERTPEQLLAEIRKNDSRAIFIAGTVATLSGVLAVWSTNSTFGSAADYIQAFIWGFGISEGVKGYRAIASELGVTPK